MKAAVAVMLLAGVAMADDAKVCLEKHDAKLCFSAAIEADKNGNYTLGAKLYEVACKGGVMPACGNLGADYANGNGVLVDAAKATTYNKKACDAKIAVACANLGHLKKDAKLLAKTCSDGNGLACAFQAELDTEHATDLYAKACELGHMPSCNTAGRRLAAAKDLVNAAKSYEKGCDGKNADACTNLGQFYVNGTGVTADMKKANELFTKACDGDVPEACVKLANSYALGRGTTIDLVKAAKLHQRSCDLENPVACTLAGIDYQVGTGVPKDATHAFPLFKKACDGGNMIGCGSLGLLYRDGVGVAKDPAKAKEVLQKACDGKYAPACKALQ
jgi:hypothetical protein